MKQNFAAFVEQAGAQTGHPVVEIERVANDGARTGLDAALLDAADTLIVIGLDMLRTRQEASSAEVEAVRRFLAHFMVGRCTASAIASASRKSFFCPSSSGEHTSPASAGHRGPVPYVCD